VTCKVDEDDTEEVIDPWFREHRGEGNQILPRALQQLIKTKASGLMEERRMEEARAWFQRPREMGQWSPRSATVQTCPDKYRALCQIYDEVKTSEATTGWMAIQARGRMVHLWTCYVEAEAVVGDDGYEVPREWGQTIRAQRKRALFNVLYPQFGTREDLQLPREGATAWRAFGRRLRGARRWHTIVEELGWDILGRIPHLEVSNHWVETGLKEAEFRIWIEAIKHFNPGGTVVVQEEN
jgi:hypothetical protein